ncbi:hypothetical protein CK203_035322 [Vitis vinifera]|uniref:Uncharacterized protein n=1 Tax=Vitis vinifera TaxID=29760 RepID=A0A438HN61_VITVI|nr:hypothetical protein CK203_035322 [Vitis vinifera]
MQLHGAEVVEMMRVAAWCLQSDITRRPSMSVVVKVLEGVIAVEDNLDYNFFNPSAQRGMEAVGCQEFVFASPLSSSVLSGPREFHPFELLDREPVTIISPLVNSLVTKNLAGID